MVFGLGKKFSVLRGHSKRVENRDLMEAICGVGILVAYADGNASHEEIESLEKLIASDPRLQHYGREIHDTLGRFETVLNASFRKGKTDILRELEDIRNTPNDVEDVMNIALTVAEASGEIDDKERAVLTEVAQRMGTSLSKFGV